MSRLILATTSSITYPHAIIATIYLVIREKSQSHHADLSSYLDTLIPLLLTKVITPAAIQGPKTQILCSREIVHVVALILNAILREADVQKQTIFFSELFKLFLTGESSSLVTFNQEQVSQKFRPLDPDAEAPQAEMVEIFVAAVSAARKEVDLLSFSAYEQTALPVPDINHLLLQAADLSTGYRNDPHRASLLKMIACILNKESKDAKISNFVDSIVHDLWTSKPDHDRRKESLELISWVAKSLVLRTHAKGYELLQLLIDLLQDEKWGIDAAKSFQTISSDDDLLNKSNHAIIRLLHKQRFFMFVFSKIVGTANSLGDDSGMHSLRCANDSC